MTYWTGSLSLISAPLALVDLRGEGREGGGGGGGRRGRRRRGEEREEEEGGEGGKGGGGGGGRRRGRRGEERRGEERSHLTHLNACPYCTTDHDLTSSNHLGRWFRIG